MTDYMVKLQRYTYIDIMKGIAILLVVLGHVLGAFYTNRKLVLPLDYRLLYVTIYSFHMPVFFVIGGLFADRWVERSFKTAVVEKIQRLAVPYLFFGFLLAIVKEYGGGYANTLGGLKAFMKALIVPFNLFWFLYILFFFFIIYYIIVHYRIVRNAKFCFWVLSLILFFVHSFLPNIWILHRFSRFLVFFSSGTYMLRILDNYKGSFEKKGHVIFFMFVIALVGYDYFYILKKYHYMNSLFFITGFLGFFCIYIVSQAIEKKADVYSSLILWGKQTMQIYCLHPFIIGALRVLFNKYMKVQYLYPITFILAFFTIIICHLLIKKMNTENKFCKIIFGLR